MSAEDEAALREHLWSHLTDGLWHDRCGWCLNRRWRGGNGVPVRVAEGSAP